MNQRHALSAGIALLLAVSLLAAADAPPIALPAPKLPELQALTAPGATHRFEELFQPFRTETAALSPDGRYLAYTVHESKALAIVVIDIDQPTVVKSRVVALTDKDATPMLADTKEATPASIRWLRWATPTRLVAETNGHQPLLIGGEWRSWPGAIIAFDADGSNTRMLVTPRDVQMLNPPPPDTRPNTDHVIPRPDEPLPQPESASPSTPSPDDIPPPEPFAADLGDIPAIPRTPHIVDLVPGEPESLIIRAEGNSNGRQARLSELFKVNIRTGALRSIAEESAEPQYNWMLDRQGRKRILVPNTTQTAFPHRFAYQPKAGVKARTLDEIAGFAGSAGFSVSPENYFGERAIPVGFDENPTIVYFASNIGRDTFGLYGLDLTTGKRTGIAFESPNLDLVNPVPGGFAEPGTLVFDRFDRKLTGLRMEDKLGTTRWLRPEWQAVQTQLEQLFSGRNVEITEWDQAGRRFLVFVHGPTDAGAFHVFDRTTGKVFELVRRAPWLDGTQTHATLSFSIPRPDGSRLDGRLTAPRATRIKPVPIVVLCQPELWQRMSSDYQPAVQALADMGFFVMQVDAHGVWGYGRHQRELAKTGFEEAQVADVVTALDWVAQKFTISKQRVAIMGERRGAWLALRAMQLRPDHFACAIGLEPTVDLAGWLEETRWTGAAAAPVLTRSFFGDLARLKSSPLQQHPELIKGAVCLFSYRAPGESPSFAYLAAKRLESALRSRNTPAQLIELDDDYNNGLPRAKAAVFREIEDYLNEHLYDYKVKIGELKEKVD